MKNKLPFIFIFPLILFSSIFSSCPQPSVESKNEEAGPNDFTIAVFAPLSSEEENCKRLKDTADWFLSTFIDSKLFSEVKVQPKIKWYDENTGLESTAAALVADDNVKAIVGPFKVNHIQTVAELCRSRLKPLLVPAASSENIVRGYAVSKAGAVKDPFLWSLSECDIAQGEVLIAKLNSYNIKKVSVLSSADLYGKTFFEWLPFQITQFGMNLVQNVRLKTKDTPEYDSMQVGTKALPLAEAVETLVSSDSECIICAVENAEDLKQIIALLSDCSQKVFFTGTAFTEVLLENIPGVLSGHFEGVSAYADPSTGFENSYQARFVTKPMFSEAQFYDSLLMGILAGEYCLKTNQELSSKNINSALKKLTTGSGYKL